MMKINIAKTYIEKHEKPITEALTWVGPAISIPALRYFQDDPQQRKELFVRDASTYTVGAMLYIGVRLAVSQLLNEGKIRLGKYKIPLFHKPLPLGKGVKEIIAVIAGLTVNVTFAGIGATYFSRLFKSKPLEQPLNPTSKPAKALYSPYPVMFQSAASQPLYHSEATYNIRSLQYIG